MSRPTAARIAKRKRQAEARRAKRRTKPCGSGWPGLAPGGVPPALLAPLIDTTTPPRIRFYGGPS